MAEIVIPYTPRPIWRDTIHPALSANRFAVLVCHRRFGKTAGTVNEMKKRRCSTRRKFLCTPMSHRFAIRQSALRGSI